MAPKRAKHGSIPNGRARNSILKKRLESLYKKANELSILCNIETFIVLINPKNEGTPTMWPSHAKAMQGITKFLAFSEHERARKMILQEKLLSDKMQEMAEKVLKLRKKNDETEMGILTTRVVDGTMPLHGLDREQLNRMAHFIGDKLKMLQTRGDELDQMQGPCDSRIKSFTGGNPFMISSENVLPFSFIEM